MAKSELAQRLQQIVFENNTTTMKDFIDALNPIIVEVELNESYSTAVKLKIFDLFTKMCNCEGRERKKYANKAARLL